MNAETAILLSDRFSGFYTLVHKVAPTYKYGGLYLHIDFTTEGEKVFGHPGLTDLLNEVDLSTLEPLDWKSQIPDGHVF